MAALDVCAEPTLVPAAEIESEIASRRSALAASRALASRLGSWLGDFCFLAETGDACGVGLYARDTLRSGQVVTEYGGPRLPLEMLERGEVWNTHPASHPLFLHETQPASHPLFLQA